HTIPSGASTTFSLRGAGTAIIGSAANAITGGGGASTISVTSDTAGATLELFQSSDYVGSWSIGMNATVEINQDASLGNAANSVAMNGATLKTFLNDITTARAFAITGASTLDIAGGSTFTMSAGIGTGSGTT